MSSQAVEHHDLGDETFMSADDLRHYMQEMQMAKAAQFVSAMDRADRARAELAKTLAQPIDATPERLREIVHNLMARLRSAAQRGDTELMVMRFPNDLCSDKGRAINNSESGWPDTLTGRPRQAYELWRDQLQPANFKLKAIIMDWPGGLPGDIGFFLHWD
ncbi:hypothetical protein [Chelatococcus reniformis]|uniref:Uncharacterized protein n=1 Tax=Chelatococcus reniformis TaxID=1494448 RepID=A0A916U0B4_9HYPH|nr:hypothetical protein [Chelatococcus reniformis]GGC53846.1 hypothetical protein GCM10010994_11030 [Chelatococcus reniformis]